MITEICNGHVVDRIAHELTDAELAAVTAELAGVGIRVEPVIDVFRTVHLWARQPTTTVQEVTALTAVKAVTDARVDWHGAVA